jgi:hypothetical protein
MICGLEGVLRAAKSESRRATIASGPSVRRMHRARLPRRSRSGRLAKESAPRGGAI